MATATGKAHGPERDHYLDLIRAFPLRPVRSDAGLVEAIKVIDSLIVRGDLDEGERDYLDVLTDIVEKYEAEELPMPPLTDAEILRHLIEAKDITQSALAAETHMAVSTVSEILAGKRKLTRDHIANVARYFNVSPALFSF